MWIYYEKVFYNLDRFEKVDVSKPNSVTLHVNGSKVVLPVSSAWWHETICGMMRSQGLNIVAIPPPG